MLISRVGLLPPSRVAPASVKLRAGASDRSRSCPESVREAPNVMSWPAVKTLVPAAPSLKSVRLLRCWRECCLCRSGDVDSCRDVELRVLVNSTFPAAVMSAVRLMALLESPASTVKAPMSLSPPPCPTDAKVMAALLLLMVRESSSASPIILKPVRLMTSLRVCKEAPLPVTCMVLPVVSSSRNSPASSSISPSIITSPPVSCRRSASAIVILPPLHQLQLHCVEL